MMLSIIMILVYIIVLTSPFIIGNWYGKKMIRDNKMSVEDVNEAGYIGMFKIFLFGV